MNKGFDALYYFKILLDSLHAVKMKLVSYDDGGKDKYVNERAFAYELYRQLANRLYNDVVEVEKWAIDRPEIVVNAELYKCVGSDNKTDRKGRKFPDIVIHGGQHNTENQLVVCEIKVKASEAEIEEDLKKLYDYLDIEKMYGHPYPLAVFINVGPIKTFEVNLKKSMLKLGKSKGRLFCISYDDGLVNSIKEQA